MLVINFPVEFVQIQQLAFDFLFYLFIHDKWLVGSAFGSPVSLYYILQVNQYLELSLRTWKLAQNVDQCYAEMWIVLALVDVLISGLDCLLGAGRISKYLESSYNVMQV